MHMVELDTRGRIVATAERLFREIGYQKTTVADIAKALKMSPANVYRFFDSKKAINEAVAERITGEIRATASTIASSERLAAERMRMLLAFLHHSTSQLLATETRMQEMVAVAMTESWQVIQAHIEAVDGIIGRIVADGIGTGEFRPGDPQVMGPCIRAAMMRFCHPGLLAQCADIPLPTAEQQIDFVLAALVYHDRS
jgi:AcrR family transcriptional regulator